MPADVRRRFGAFGCGLLLATAVAAAPPASGTVASSTSPPVASDRSQINLATFDRTWSLIADTHWDPTLGGLDWKAVRDELRPRAATARSDRELRVVIDEMLGRLGQSHFALLPGATTDTGGSGDDTDADALPGCSRAASAEIVAAMGRHRTGGGEPGLELRRVEGNQVLVTRVVEGGPADRAGVAVGWRLLAVNGRTLDRSLHCIARIEDPSFQRQIQIHWLRGMLEGAVGSAVRLRFDGGGGREKDVTLRREPPAGELVRFGNLPPSPVDFETTSIETRNGARVGVVRFNMWLPVTALQFESAMNELREGRGVVIDLRGNPGGVAAVAQGVAGQFIGETVSLGTMQGRNDKLELVAHPRRVTREGKAVEPFAGPLAILIDEGSASTSEIFAAGLRDHDRARVFGLPSAGAALPAVMDRLPNGDVFMHASMDYIRPNGERVEGRPVVPDVETPLRRADLKAGRDAALEAALAWIDGELVK